MTASRTAALLRFPRRATTAPDPHVAKPHPFVGLSTGLGRPLRIAILSDFVRIPYANGAVFQTRLLYQELRRYGHEVTVIGAHDPDAIPEDLAPGTIQLPSIPLRTYPGVHLPMPMARWVFDPDRWDFDIIYAQVTSLVHHFGIWLREMKGIPLLMVNTTHLAAAYDVLLPESLSKIEAVHAGLEFFLKRPYERTFAEIYNQGDGLVVLSEGLRTYWRERGVTAPIHVIPRAVQPEIFDRAIGDDPYEAFLPTSGPRLLCAGRHTREKSQDRVLRIFAKHVLPAIPHATLTMLGVGPDTDDFKQLARDLGIMHRVAFPGEVPFTAMPSYYAYADVFVHGSQSETYGNVLGEALWCGTPTVAFADGMGVSAQLFDGENGIMIQPGKGHVADDEADAAFGASVVRLIGDPQLRARLSRAASRIARERAHPHVVMDRIANAFRSARDHADVSGLRPAAQGPRVMKWMTTMKHVRPWGVANAGMYLIGHLRPGKAVERPIHPQFAK
jgi:1,2-diacylglycerol 3-alpha-glucosyltransferase